MKYKEVYEDHRFLWSIGPANDMVVGYCSDNDLQLMLSCPTKNMAKLCLIRQMMWWFSEGLANDNGKGIDPHEFENKYPRIRKIAERYEFDYY